MHPTIPTDAEHRLRSIESLDQAIRAMRDLQHDLRISAVLAGEHEAAGDQLIYRLNDLIQATCNQRSRIADTAQGGAQ